ncbi:MAG: PqqD family protein [Burkholderiales bacterium]
MLIAYWKACWAFHLSAETDRVTLIVISLRRRLDGVLVQDLESEVVVLDREADKIHQLNQTATFIWRHVEETPSADKMAKLLAESFEVEEQVAVRDVLEALNQLRALNLVQEC